MKRIHAPVLALALSPLALGLMTACSDDDENNGTTPDAGTSDGPIISDGATDQSPPDGATPDMGPKTVAPKVDPKEYLPTEWMVASYIGSTSADPVRAALMKGTFTYPKAGKDSTGTTWGALTPTAGGKVGSFPKPTSSAYWAWAVAKVTLKAPARLMIMSGPTYEVWVNGKMRPGDVYGSRKPYLALPAAAGENIVVVRYYVRRAVPAAPPRPAPAASPKLSRWEVPGSKRSAPPRLLAPHQTRPWRSTAMPYSDAPSGGS